MRHYLFTPFVFVFLIMAMHTAFAAGAYIVDDAGIVEPGTIQSESWYTHAARGVDVGTLNLSYQFLPDTEFALQEAHIFQPGGNNTVAPQMKYAWYKSEATGFAVSPVVGMLYTTFQSHTLSPYAYIPITLEVTPDLEIDGNLGWQYDNLTDRHFLTWGFKGSYHVTPTLSLASDIFGRSVGDPGFQLGPHFSVSEHLEFDLVYGRNVFSHSENTGTAGITLMF